MFDYSQIFVVYLDSLISFSNFQLDNFKISLDNSIYSLFGIIEGKKIFYEMEMEDKNKETLTIQFKINTQLKYYNKLMN